MIDFTDLNGVLIWLAGAGMVTWCVQVSDFFRNATWHWYTKLQAIYQQLVVIAAMVLPPAAAYIILQTVPQSVIDMLAPHYAFVAALFTAVVAARGFFEATKHRSPDMLIVEGEPDEVKTLPVNEAERYRPAA